VCPLSPGAKIDFDGFASGSEPHNLNELNFRDSEYGALRSVNLRYRSTHLLQHQVASDNYSLGLRRNGVCTDRLSMSC
jgi:hypothetical protein